LADKVLAVRMWALAAGHAVVFAFVYWLAFVLRLDFPFPSASSDTFWASLPWIVGVKVGIFYLCGHYRGWWRYVTFADLVALLRASGLSMLAVMTIGYVVFPGRIPRSIPIIDLGLTILFLGSLRASWRVFREHFWPSLRPKDYRWALVVGTDEATGVLAHQIQSSLGLPYRVRGFLHTDGKTGPAQLGRIPVLGHVDNVGRIAAACGASDILITADILPGQQIRRLMETCRQSGLTLKIIPPLKNRLDGSNRIPIRDIEINDLLRRDPVELDTQAIAQLLAGRRVLVTGAGGSIGSEICRQVLQYAPQSLLLLGRGENRIFNIERELRPSPLSRLGRGAGGEGNGDGRLTQIYSRIADITDEPRMRQIFAEFRPEIVFHAAAHKHVPLMEDNPGEAVKNNVLGTKCVADLAHEYEAENFVLISTDKAVRPTSVMGATKHLAERYVLALSEESETRFVVTRFGNVLGSAGSVVPIFQDQIQRGGPITVTDPEMTRFFMTIPEASQLVLQAAAMGKGGEIFVLEMGEPVKIVNLARDLIRLSGLSEHSIEIVYTGIRPGEKLYEELYFEDEKTLPTSHHKLRVAYHRPYTIEDVRSEVTELIGLADRPDVCICSILRRFVPEYTPCCGDCHQCPKYQEPHPASPIRKVIKPGRFSITP
jgi:FlaA1/EpsC-like NDP-sugar epimerase